MHDEIRKFTLEGEMSDYNLAQTRERMILFIEGTMRTQGYVPTLDNEPQFTRNYNPEKDSFDFKLTVYGVKLQEGDPWSISGIMNGNAIPKYTPKDRSKESLKTVA